MQGAVMLQGIAQSALEAHRQHMALLNQPLLIPSFGNMFASQGAHGLGQGILLNIGAAYGIPAVNPSPETERRETLLLLCE